MSSRVVNSGVKALPHAAPQPAQRVVCVDLGLPLFGTQLVIGVADAAGRIVVKAAGHERCPARDCMAGIKTSLTDEAVGPDT